MDAPPSYDDDVDHPRYGRAPRRTSVRVEVDAHPLEVSLHWHNGPFYGERAPEPLLEWREHGWTVPGTAVVADEVAQNAPVIAITHYFDLDRRCVDCRRRFLFFAAEQKHWYEELRLPLDAHAIRCVECRKAMREAKAKQRRYVELVALEQRSPEEDLEVAVTFLDLVEVGFFRARSLDRVRRHLNASREALGEDERRDAAQSRLLGFQGLERRT